MILKPICYCNIFQECMEVRKRRMLNYTCIVAKWIHLAQSAGESPRDLGTCWLVQNNNQSLDWESDHFQILTTSFKGNADFSIYGNGTLVYLFQSFQGRGRKTNTTILIGLKARLFIFKMLICFLYSVFTSGLVIRYPRTHRPLKTQNCVGTNRKVT